MGSITITATLEVRGPAAAVVLDAEQVAIVGEGAKRFPVAATINDVTWRTTVTRMGGEHLLGLSKEVRAGCGVQAGDEVDVTISLDAAPRHVELPPELADALAAQPELRTRFDALAASYRKEHARAVADAKAPATRERRVQKVLDALRG